MASTYSRYGCWDTTDDLSNLKTPKYETILQVTQSQRIPDELSVKDDIQVFELLLYILIGLGSARLVLNLLIKTTLLCFAAASIAINVKLDVEML